MIAYMYIYVGSITSKGATRGLWLIWLGLSCGHYVYYAQVWCSCYGSIYLFVYVMCMKVSMQEMV